MNFSDPLFLLPILCGPIFIIAGYTMLKLPPKWPNTLYGYRTPRALKNEENWNFAQPYSAKELMKSGVVFTLLAVVAPFTKLEHPMSLIIALGLLFIFAGYPIYKTERALKAFEKRN